MRGAWLFPLLLAAFATAPPLSAEEERVLRVCADPNNMPFSNDRREGFENRIVDLVARDLGARVEYVWWAQRRGFLRSTLKEGRCDLVPGIASGVEAVATTRPYYRSSYVFVSAAAEGPPVESLDDPRLRDLVIGVQMIGDDFSNSPPAHGLARRGLVANVRGFMVYGDYATDSPPRRIVDAVASGEIDVALVWGPLAGYFASREAKPLRLAPVTPQMDGPLWPMVFDISMATRRDDVDLRRAVERALARNRAGIAAILDAYDVPRLALPGDVVRERRP